MTRQTMLTYRNSWSLPQGPGTFSPGSLTQRRRATLSFPRPRRDRFDSNRALIIAPARLLEKARRQIPGLSDIGNDVPAVTTSGLNIVPRAVERKNPKRIEATRYVRVEGSQPHRIGR